MAIFCTSKWNCFVQHPKCDRLLLIEVATVLEYNRVMFLLHASAGPVRSSLKRNMTCEMGLGVWGIGSLETLQTQRGETELDALSSQHTSDRQTPSVTEGMPPRLERHFPFGQKTASCGLFSCPLNQSLFYQHGTLPNWQSVKEIHLFLKAARGVFLKCRKRKSKVTVKEK